MPNYDALQTKKRSLIRKTLDGSLMVGPQSAPIITTIQGTDGLLEISPLYRDAGWTSGDGHQFERDIEMSNTTGYGSVSPLRTDFTSITTTMQAQMIETNKTTLEMYNFLQLDSLETEASGELVIDEPSRPRVVYYRALSLHTDLTDDGEIYMARHLPLLAPTDYGGWTAANGDDPAMYDITFTGYKDDNAPAHRWLFGGPGWIALLESMGFDPLTP